MEITYANSQVERYFTDYARMQKKLPFAWVRVIKKHIDRLKAAACFGDFLALRLGKPERLSGYSDARYSLHVSTNARLVIAVGQDEKTVALCTVVEVEGVSDYHGGKENWYLP